MDSFPGTALKHPNVRSYTPRSMTEEENSFVPVTQRHLHVAQTNILQGRCYSSLYMLVRHTSAHLRTGGNRCCEPESRVSQLALNPRCHFPPISRYRSQLSPTTFNPPPWWSSSKHSTRTKAREEELVFIQLNLNLSNNTDSSDPCFKLRSPY